MDKKLKILLLEDLPSDVKLIWRVLKKEGLEFEGIVVETRDGFIDALKDFSPDVILSDHTLPSFNSHEALNIMRHAAVRVPFILVTATISEDFAVDVIKRGADDYILKDRLERLPTAIHNALEKFRLEKERQIFLDELIKNEKHYRALIENINDAIILVNRRMELVYQSPSVERLTGFTFGELSNIKIIELIHPDDRQEYSALFHRASAEYGVPIVSQYRILHKKGHQIWIDGMITNLLHDASVKAFIVNFRDITKRKQAEDGLRKSEFRYRQIVETAHEGIWLIDEFNRTTFVNKKMCEILEYPKEEILGKEIFYFMDDVGKRDVTKSLERRKRGVVENLEIRYITKSQRHIRATVSANPIFDDFGKYVGALAMVTDITEKKNLEDLLSRANNLARIGNWEVDLIKNTLFWSDITREIHEVTSDYIPSLQTAIDFYKPGPSRDAISRVIQQAIEHDISWDIELQIITARNNVRWVRAIGGPEFINGQCIRVYGTFQDIDAGKKAEMEVLRVNAERNIILESIGDAFFAVDKNWVVTYWNNHAEKILESPKNKVVGHHLWDIFSDSIDSVSFNKYHQAVETGQIIQFEDYYEPLRKWCEIVAYPSDTGLSVYFKDITAKKRFEQRAQEQKLEEQKKITKAVVNAQEKERAEIGQELHDNVNQLLAASQLYLNHSLSQEDYAASIVKSQEYIKIAMDEIRKLSHALVGPGKEDMTGLCDSLKELINNIFAVKDIKFSFNHSSYHEEENEEGLKLVIYRIIQEQLSNILKYAEASEVEIELKNEDDRLIAVIKDNGKGFDTSEKRNGIGLKNIKNRAEVYNGKVQILSSPGNGCKMTVVFNSQTG